MYKKADRRHADRNLAKPVTLHDRAKAEVKALKYEKQIHNVKQASNVRA